MSSFGNYALPITERPNLIQSDPNSSKPNIGLWIAIIIIFIIILGIIFVYLLSRRKYVNTNKIFTPPYSS